MSFNHVSLPKVDSSQNLRGVVPPNAGTQSMLYAADVSFNLASTLNPYKWKASNVKGDPVQSNGGINKKS